jgi:hypothetical protein
VTQPSLFSADLLPPAQLDLGGLLAAHGQMVGGPQGSRISILLTDAWRADSLIRECAARDLIAETVRDRTDGAVLLRTERSAKLDALTTRWTRGAVKAPPPDLVIDAGLLRIWLLAAGRPDAQGYLLGLDPHAAGMHSALAAALARAGLAGSVTGVQSGWPAVRLTGRRRAARLAEMIGDPPSGAPDGIWPVPGR